MPLTNSSFMRRRASGKSRAKQCRSSQSSGASRSTRRLRREDGMSTRYSTTFLRACGNGIQTETQRARGGDEINVWSCKTVAFSRLPSCSAFLSLHALAAITRIVVALLALLSLPLAFCTAMDQIPLHYRLPRSGYHFPMLVTPHEPCLFLIFLVSRFTSHSPTVVTHYYFFTSHLRPTEYSCTTYVTIPAATTATVLRTGVVTCFHVLHYSAFALAPAAPYDTSLFSSPHTIIVSRSSVTRTL